MSEPDLREKLRGEIAEVDAAALLPHQRRDALLIVLPEVDLLDAAVVVASDEAERVAALLAEKKMYKPTLGQLADWCVDLDLRFQYVILQPYVLAQVLPRPKLKLS